eukprot:6199664-Pleurochrysis_carterae.AAC.2
METRSRSQQQQAHEREGGKQTASKSKEKAGCHNLVMGSARASGRDDNARAPSRRGARMRV